MKVVVSGGTGFIGRAVGHALVSRGASLVGLTRETTTNELSKLKSEKVLRYSTHRYAIDKAKLERLLGEDSFDNLKTSR